MWLFILKEDGFHPRGTSTGDALLHFPPVQPPTIEWVASDIVWATHFMIHGELLHKPIVGLTQGSAFLEYRKRRLWR